MLLPLILLLRQLLPSAAGSRTYSGGLLCSWSCSSCRYCFCWRWCGCLRCWDRCICCCCYRCCCIQWHTLRPTAFAAYPCSESNFGLRWPLVSSATASTLLVSANAQCNRLFSRLLMLPNPVQTMGLLAAAALSTMLLACQCCRTVCKLWFQR